MSSTGRDLTEGFVPHVRWRSLVRSPITLVGLLGGLGLASGCAQQAAVGREPCPPGLPECPELDPAERRESKEAVDAAERARRRASFAQEVAALRAQLAARTASTSSPRPGSPRVGPRTVESFGPAAPRDPPSGIDRPGGPRPPSKRASEPRPPPPVLLAAAACLLAEDTRGLEAQLRAARLEGRQQAATLALVWVDATELARRIDLADLRTRPPCGAPDVVGARRNLRALVGSGPPLAVASGGVERFERGLRRLEAELRTHADLPK